jgi:hypothetical protein
MQRFEAFEFEFNTEPPHQALDMKCPAERRTLPHLDTPL